MKKLFGASKTGGEKSGSSAYLRPGVKAILGISISLMILTIGIGCETTRPVARYPGLAPQPGGETCVLREAEHCFIGSIDDQPIAQYDVNIIYPATYREYRLPAGAHVLTVYFRQDDNFEVISGGPRHVNVQVQGDHRYVLKSNLNSMDVAFGDSLSNVSWRPEVEDTKTGKCAGEASLNMQ